MVAIARGWRVTSPAGQALPKRGIGRTLAEKGQRAIVRASSCWKIVTPTFLCNAVGGDHIPQVDLYTVYQAQPDGQVRLRLVA